MCLYKREAKGRFDTHIREEGNVTTGAKTRVMQPKLDECREPLAAERNKEQILPQSLRREHGLPTP